MEQKDDVKEMEIKPNELNKAINGLDRGFIWTYSKEGFEYWHKIYIRLEEIKGKGR